MKVQIEFDDFESFMKNFNNAIIAYQDVLGAVYLGIEVPNKWAPFMNEEKEVIQERVKVLVDCYRQLEKIEKSLN